MRERNSVKKFLLSTVCVLLLSSCANTRDPQPCQLVQSNDVQMDCELIVAEYNTNTDVAAAKIEKNNEGDNQDVLLGVLIWPGLADFKNADGVEGNALLDRNIRLFEIAKMKGCSPSAFLAQPARYK